MQLVTSKFKLTQVEFFEANKKHARPIVATSEQDFTFFVDLLSKLKYNSCLFQPQAAIVFIRRINLRNGKKVRTFPGI